MSDTCFFAGAEEATRKVATICRVEYASPSVAYHDRRAASRWRLRRQVPDLALRNAAEWTRLVLSDSRRNLDLRHAAQLKLPTLSDVASTRLTGDGEIAKQVS